MANESGAVDLANVGESVDEPSDVEVLTVQLMLAQQEIRKYQEFVGQLVMSQGGVIELTEKFLEEVDLDGKALQIEENEVDRVVYVKVVDQGDVVQ